MGFKCPICLEDFGKDKAAHEKHMQEKHDGLAADFKKALMNVAEGGNAADDD